MIERKLSETQQQIMRQIKKDVENKVTLKKGYRKKLKKTFERFLRKIMLLTFSCPLQVKKYNGNSSLGYDEFGRDVEDGLYRYIEILRRRGIKIHTLIVLGSRAKGTWNPQSDVDVTIIASNLPKEKENFLLKRLLSQGCSVLSDHPLYMGIEPSGCCSKEEFMRRLRSFDIQVLDALLYGRVIYDDGFWEMVKAEYKQMERKFKLNDLPLMELLFPL